MTASSGIVWPTHSRNLGHGSERLDAIRLGDKISRRAFCNLGCAHQVVASVGHDRDWAAYVGDVGQDALEVARWGEKVPADVAGKLFPEFVLLRYRE